MFQFGWKNWRKMRMAWKNYIVEDYSHYITLIIYFDDFVSSQFLHKKLYYFSKWFHLTYGLKVKHVSFINTTARIYMHILLHK